LLDENFVNSYATRQVDWGPLGQLVYKRSYAQPGEVWYLTVERVVNACYQAQQRHCENAGIDFDLAKAQHSAQQMYDLMFNFKFLPPGRGLANMGTSLLEDKGGAVVNNCGWTEVRDTSDFVWAMDMLLKGVGIGFSAVENIPFRFAGGYTIEHQVHDSVEGWSEALRVLLQQYEQGGGVVKFDYSFIRPAGAPIRGVAGKAPGPEPLRECLESVRSVFVNRIKSTTDGWFELTPADIVDIMNHIGKACVAGGVRRSAEIAIGSSDDQEFAKLKNRDINQEAVDGHRWAANHSVYCEVGDDYRKILHNFDGVDELGIYWLGNAQAYSRMGRRADRADQHASGCNPCAEQTLEHRELCCLVEVFVSRHSSFYELQKTLKYAYLYAKAVTLIETHDQETNRIIERNRRIGCSLTGIQEAYNKLGREFYGWCNRGYKYIQSLDDRYSTWFNIPRSIKTTSVKPSGSVSKLPGVSSGIHWPISEYYIQRIRLSNNSPYVEPYKSAGYNVVDISSVEPNTTVIEIPVRERNFTRSESDVSIWEQAEHAAKMQHYWADNQVSMTIKYAPHEKAQIPALLELYEDRLKAISFFPQSDGHSFDYAPWEEITKDEYLRLTANLEEVNLDDINEHELEDQFCEGGACEIP